VGLMLEKTRPAQGLFTRPSSEIALVGTWLRTSAYSVPATTLNGSGKVKLTVEIPSGTLEAGTRVSVSTSFVGTPEPSTELSCKWRLLPDPPVWWTVNSALTSGRRARATKVCAARGFSPVVRNEPVSPPLEQNASTRVMGLGGGDAGDAAVARR